MKAHIAGSMFSIATIGALAVVYGCGATEGSGGSSGDASSGGHHKGGSSANAGGGTSTDPTGGTTDGTAGGGMGGSGAVTSGASTGGGTTSSTGAGGGACAMPPNCHRCGDFLTFNSPDPATVCCGTSQTDLDALGACTCDPQKCGTPCGDQCPGQSGGNQLSCYMCVMNTCGAQYDACQGD